MGSEQIRKVVLRLVDMLVASGALNHEQHVELLKMLLGEDGCDD